MEDIAEIKPGYIETLSGKRVDLSKSVPEIAGQIDIEDIAAGLSNMTRYSGQLNRHYSVAEHSLHVAGFVGHTGDARLQLYCLLHDASEAYLADIPAPFKQSLPDYQAMEAKLEAAIRVHFGFTLEEHREYYSKMKEADYVVLLAECMTLRMKSLDEWANPQIWQANKEFIESDTIPSHVPPAIAKGAFLKAFRQIKEGKLLEKPFESAVAITKYLAGRA